MPGVRALLWLSIVAVVADGGYRLVFPPEWTVGGQGNSVQVQAGDRVARVVATPGAPQHALSAADQGAEVSALNADLTRLGLGTDGAQPTARIVLTSSGEPMIVLEYGWKEMKRAGTSGRGLRLVRSCDTRVVVDQQADAPSLPWLTEVTGGVYYNAPECLRYNLETTARIVEGSSTRLPPPPVVQTNDVSALETLQAVPQDVQDSPSRTWLWWILGGMVALLGLLALKGGRSTVQPTPPQRHHVRPAMKKPNAESPPGGHAGGWTTTTGEQRRPSGSPKEVDFRAKAEPVPVQTGRPSNAVEGWGFSGARPETAGGQPSGRPAEEVPAASGSVGTYNMRMDASDPRRRLENALMKLGAEVWLDCVSPGILSPASLQAPLIDLLRIQNGARYGHGWLVLLGVDQAATDIRVVNQDPGLKERMGEGTCFGITCFGDALFLTPDNKVEIRFLSGGRREVGRSLVEALEELGRDPEARKRLADTQRFERFRSFLGDLPPGNVFVEMGGDDLAATNVATSVPFLEALLRK